MKVISQNNFPRLWTLTNYSGEIKVLAIYKEKHEILTYENKEKNRELSGGFSLKTTSNILSPKFLVLDANGEYNPSKKDQTQLVFPDIFEDRSLYKLSFRTHFFKNEFINFGLTADFSDGFTNRENLNYSKVNHKGYGGFINLKSNKFPVGINILKSESVNNEIETGRVRKFNRFEYNAKGSIILSKQNKVRLNYNHFENVNMYSGAFTDNISYKSDMASCSHDFSYGKNKMNYINSDLLFHNQFGHTTHTRLNFREQIGYNLPLRFFLNSSYSYMKTLQKPNISNQNIFQVSLLHKLRKSFRSTVSAIYGNTNHTLYKEYYFAPEIKFEYEKKLPFNNRFIINYNYSKRFNNNISDPNNVNVVGEQITLTDGQITLLYQQQIEKSSIVVSDITGVILYQLNLDYVIISHDPFIEIQRIPGGQISNNSTVNVNYIYKQNNSNKYTLNSNRLYCGIFLYKDIFNIYYSISNTNYSNVFNMENNSLRYYTMNTIGIRIQYSLSNLGAEFTEYKSNIIPYRSEKYYLQFNKQFFNKLNLLFNGNYLKYIYADLNETNEFADILGSIGYKLTYTTEISFESSYRKQIGKQIDMDLFIARLRFKTSHGKMYFSCGADVYRRLYIGQTLNFNSVFVQLSRKFGK